MRDKVVLRKEGPLRVLLDSRSLEASIDSPSRQTLRLINYQTTTPFEFVRSPFPTGHGDLQQVVAFEWKRDESSLVNGIRIETDRLTRETSLTSDSHALYGLVVMIGRTEFGKEVLTENEKESILLVKVGQALAGENNPCLLVTDNELLLQHRLSLENRLGGLQLASPFIVTVQEALEILDFYTKYQDKYLIGPSTSTSKWFWYWLAFRSQIPRYQVGGPNQNALAARYVFLLMSIDETGFEYYSRVNNTTMENLVYHFNYSITLITGILDSLALFAKEKLALRFDDDNLPERTSLNPRAGDDFLRAMRERNAPLRNHVNASVLFIKLIYKLREQVIHRQMLEESRVENVTESWKANLLRIDEETYRWIQQCGNGRVDYEPFTRWGTCSIGTDWFLEPFHFAKSAVQILGIFCNTFLELLGNDDFVGGLEQAASNGFLRDLRCFREGGLRYYS